MKKWKEKRKEKEKRSKHALRAQAESRGQGCYLLARSVLRSVQLVDQHKDAARRPDRKQEDKKRVETNNKQQTKNEESYVQQFLGQVRHK